MPARRNSSASIGTSNLFELNPIKSHPSIQRNRSLAIWAKLGQSFTSSSVMPCTAVLASGICMPGLMRRVLVSSLPSGYILITDNSMMRSSEIEVPVVSRSNTIAGLARESCIVSYR